METNGDRVVSKWGGGDVARAGLYIGSVFNLGNFLVIWGGGHTDYSGNEVYAYGPFEVMAPAWNRLRDPTSPPLDDVNIDGSGNLVSRHTYQSLACVSDGVRNAMYAIGCRFRYHDGGGGLNNDSYNFNQVSPNSNQPWVVHTDLQGSGPSPGAAIVSAYEASSGKIWYCESGNNVAANYVVATDAYNRKKYRSPNFGNNACSAMDQNRGIWAIWDGVNGLYFYRTDDITTEDYYHPSVSGTAPTGQGGIVWDPALDAFVIWANSGKTYYKLTPPVSSPYQGGNAWVWSSVTPGSGSTPDAETANGVFGRFNILTAAAVQGYVLMNTATGVMYFFRTGDGVSAPGLVLPIVNAV
jgi:hypothetical protein